MPPPPAARLRVIHVPCSSPADTLAGAVASGLGSREKSLPCRFFYDETGSRLFERICALPEYYPTRTEEGILRRNASDIVAAGAGVSLSEFGSGSSVKTRILIEALLERQDELLYVPIDISLEFLEESARALLERYRGLWMTAIGGEYNDAIPYLPAHSGPRLILFLGGNIGNLDWPAATRFLRRVRRTMRPDDRLLVGFDQLKSPSIITAAYNDSAGVTAAFNKTLLARINRELGGGFDLDSFEHQAPFVEERARVEMRRDQVVRVSALDRTFAFSRNESIHTENCHKYTLETFAELASAAGLEVCESWSDDRHWFRLALLGRKAGAPVAVAGPEVGG